MNILELGAIGELVGGVAVIASLIFVGAQIRFNARSVQINSTLGVIQSWVGANNDLCRDPELAELFQSALRSERVNQEDLDGRLNFFLRSAIQRLEAEYYLYTRGLVEHEIWAKHLAYFRNLTRTPTGKSWWDRELSESPIYTDAFIHQLKREEA